MHKLIISTLFIVSFTNLGVGVGICSIIIIGLFYFNLVPIHLFESTPPPGTPQPINTSNISSSNEIPIVESNDSNTNDTPVNKSVNKSVKFAEGTKLSGGSKLDNKLYKKILNYQNNSLTENLKILNKYLNTI